MNCEFSFINTQKVEQEVDSTTRDNLSPLFDDDVEFMGGYLFPNVGTFDNQEVLLGEHGIFNQRESDASEDECTPSYHDVFDLSFSQNDEKSSNGKQIFIPF